MSIEFLDRLILTNIVSYFIYFYLPFFSIVLELSILPASAQALMSWPTQWRLRPVAKACAGATCCPFSKSRSVELQMWRGRMTLNWNSWHMSRNMLICKLDHVWFWHRSETSIWLYINHMQFGDVLKMFWRSCGDSVTLWAAWRANEAAIEAKPSAFIVFEGSYEPWQSVGIDRSW